MSRLKKTTDTKQQQTRQNYVLFTHFKYKALDEYKPLNFFSLYLE